MELNEAQSTEISHLLEVIAANSYRIGAALARPTPNVSNILREAAQQNLQAVATIRTLAPRLIGQAVEVALERNQRR